MITDTINFALITWGVPEKFRAYIDALIGASRGSTDWFEAADIEIGQRARPVSTTGLKEKSVERWTMRQRDEFSEWQKAYGVTLIETMPGGMKGGVKYKTRYKLENLFEIALEIAHRAKSLRGYDTNPKRCMRKAAESVYKEFKSRLNDPPKRQRFKNHYQDSETCLTVIRTYIEKYCGLALLENRKLADGLLSISLLINEKIGMVAPRIIQFHNDDISTKYINLPEISRVTPASPEIEARDIAESPFSNNPQTNSNDSRQPARDPEPAPESQPVHSLSINRVYKTEQSADCGAQNDRDSARLLRESPLLNATILSDSQGSLCDGESRKKRGAAPESVRAVAVFASVGCDQFEWFLVDGNNKKSGPLYEKSSAEEFAYELREGLLLDAERGETSLVVRPRGAAIIQIDDIGGECVEVLKPLAFFAEETSLGNYQTFLALKDEADKQAVHERLFAQLDRLWPGANPAGGGSLRWPGTVNFKKSRGCFRVRMIYAAPGRFTTPQELEDAHLLHRIDSQPRLQRITQNDNANWPDYELCLAHKTDEDGKEHPGRADALFVYRALLRGHSAEAIAEKLSEVSEKAKTRGKSYIESTIKNGIRHLERGSNGKN